MKENRFLTFEKVDGYSQYMIYVTNRNKEQLSSIYYVTEKDHTFTVRDDDMGFRRADFDNIEDALEFAAYACMITYQNFYR